MPCLLSHVRSSARTIISPSCTTANRKTPSPHTIYTITKIWLRGVNGLTVSYPTVLSVMTVMNKASSNDQPSTNQNHPVPTNVRITSTATIQAILRIDLGMVVLRLIDCHGENRRLVFTLQSTRATQATHASTRRARLQRTFRNLLHR